MCVLVGRMVKPIMIYEPDNSIKKGYVPLLGEIFHELADNRWLTYQLFKRDFVATYKQSFIGIVWAFIVPLVSVTTFIVLDKSGLFSLGEISIPYPVYAILGMAFWQLFSTGLIGSSNALVRAGSMITQINFSKKSLVIASAGQAFVSFLIQLLLLVILCVVYRVLPSAEIVLVPVLAIPITLFTLGLGLILSLLNGVVRDIGNVISLLMTFLMFLTPVLYAKPKTGILARISDYNPLYYMVSGPRDLALTGRMPELKGFIITSVISAALFLVCLIAFHLTETRISERV